MAIAKKCWDVHKFGGTSVGNADRYRGVSRIIRNLGISAREVQPRAIVVSAMKGVTDALIDVTEAARRQDRDYLRALEAIKNRHLEAADQLLKPGAAGIAAGIKEALIAKLEADFSDISEILRGILLSKSSSDRNIELISGYGEVWSAQFLDAYFREQGLASRWLDAREVLVVEPHEKSVTVDWQESAARLQRWLKGNPTDLVVITGFVASTPEGVATTLRRNGSDYSASIFGALLDADKITIWTDVDGVLSADPRLVPDAVVLDELSYSEMSELAYFGAKVVHPSTVAPAIGKNIPIWIRNTFNPDFAGTKIHSTASSEKLVKGFSVIEKMALVNVEGTGMAGVPGIAERLFGALRSTGVSVVMISQASSEHSICFAIYESQAELARKAVEKQFYAELQQGMVQRIEVTRDCGILAVVGDNMVRHPGVAGRFFDALGKARINIRAIAQGSSERNISAVIKGEDSVRALRAVHSAFYLSKHTLSVGLIGTGLIGKAFLSQLQKQLEYMSAERGIDVRIRAIMNSRTMLLSDAGIPLGEWDSKLQANGVPPDLDRFVAHVKSDHLPHSVIIDATANAEIPSRYPHWLGQGLNVITPNKKGNTADYASYRQIREAMRTGSRHFLYSTNVGAGLPIIQTLRELHRTGDRILRIEGVLSGTLSYIFNSYDGAKPFSEVVSEARVRGLTEPDPRDDLSGTDVARKLVILAREIGLELELADVEVKGLVPAALQKGDAEAFLRGLPQFDAEMRQNYETVRAQGKVLRYVGMLELGEGEKQRLRARVGLESYSLQHPFSRLHGSDNIVAFKTARYDAQPLVIQGPGAGPEVTAGGVFADLLRLASYLGAPT